MTPTRFAQATGTLLALVAAVSDSGSAADGIPQFVARDGAFHVVRDGQDTRLFVHAVNLGVGVPGTQPGALAATEAQYTNWLRQMRLHQRCLAVGPGLDHRARDLRLRGR